MTKQEAAIVSAYTGYLIGDFSDLHAYIEQLLKRPVWTHELANKELAKEIQRLSHDDFVAMEVR